jgi:hypothetical protein
MGRRAGLHRCRIITHLTSSSNAAQRQEITMGFIKTAYRAMQTRFAAFMWAHADEDFVQRCITECVELISIDDMAREASERIIDAVDLEGITREVEQSLIENTDVDTDDIVEKIVYNLNTDDIERMVTDEMVENISVSQCTEAIVETVGDEVKDDCIEQIMEQIEDQREGWAEVIAQRLVKNDAFLTAIAIALVRNSTEATNAKA